MRGKNPNKREQGEEDITTKEIHTAIKKLRRRKIIGPDEIPNEVFIEAYPTTRELLRQAINQVHQEETIPNSWLQGHITRLYKGKGTKGKCSKERGITLVSNAGKLYERIINERVKNVTEITEAQAGGIPGSATADHLIALKQTIRELRKKRENCVCNIFRRTESLRQSLAWRHPVCNAQKRSNREKPRHDQKTKSQPDCQNSYQIRSNKGNKNQRQHAAGRSTASNRICHSNRRNSERTKGQGKGLITENGTKIDSLLWMDDVCLIHHDPK